MGLLRLILALSVVAGHSHGWIFGVKLFPESTAVNVFFIISGFYMALVLNEKYLGTGATRAFFLARALRLYPTYYIGLTIAVVANLIYFGMPFHGATFNLDTVGQVYFALTNVLIIGQDLPYNFCIPVAMGSCASSSQLSILLPAWTLAVEIMFYILAPFFIRSVPRVLLFCAVSLFYLRFTNYFGDFIRPIAQPPAQDKTYALHLYFFLGCFLYFGLGAVGYHLMRLFRAKQFSLAATVVTLCIASALVLRPELDDAVLRLHEALVLMLAIPLLFVATRHLSVDRTIGELSYAVYIVHYPIVMAFQFEFPGKPFVATAAAVSSVVIAAAIHFAVERPIDRVRSRLSKNTGLIEAPPYAASPAT